MKEKSCLNNLVSLYDKVTHLADERKAVDVVFLDFSKAFDTVPHGILLDKMSNCEMSRNTVRWVRSRLNGRTQRVVVNGATSGWQLATSGVPQGSTLEPVMFKDFINNLDAGVESIISKLGGAVDFLKEQEMAQSCISKGSNLTLGNISLLRGWSNPGTGFLERWSMP